MRAVIGPVRPAKIIVCMLYYPAEPYDASSWAARTLGWLGYDRDPARLRAVIDALFEHATRRISIEGCTVVPLALARVLDSKDPRDYVQRVEPSALGGAKMAHAIAALL